MTRAGQRGFDLACSALGVALLWPLLAAVSLAILVADGRPVFFRQQRVGRRGAPFRIWKFRTMVCDAEKLGAQVTAGRDPRITRIGAWLRRTKLDELPQLMNVIVGDMSLVGPRPEVPRYVAAYSARERPVLRHRPGITDPASSAFRDEAELLGRFASAEQVYVRCLVPAKAVINLAYARRASLATDVRVIVDTIFRHRSQPPRRIARLAQVGSA